MKRLNYGVIVLLAILLCAGCNIVPKSVQYQREEEKLIGSTDTMNPLLEKIQVILKNEGYDQGNTDGKMGKETRDAIRSFQETQGIKSTGYIDKVTLMQIEDLSRAREVLKSKKEYAEKIKSASKDKKDASIKAFTPDIRQIQTALKNAGFDPGSIDGKMGPKTRQAIREFQKSKGLVTDGVVGKKTWAALSKYL